MSNEQITADVSIVNHIGQEWNEARAGWSDQQATAFYDNCIYPLIGQVEKMGKDARDVVRIADTVQAQVDRIMGSR